MRRANAALANASRWTWLLQVSLAIVSSLIATHGFARAPWMPNKLVSVPLKDWVIAEAAGCRAASAETQRIFEALRETSGATKAVLFVCSSLADDARALPNGRIEIGTKMEKLARCERTFVLGHELAHVALGHADFEAYYLSALARLPRPSAADAYAAADFDFSLALDMQQTAQEDEYEADWVGSLLAGTRGCSLKRSAEAYFRSRMSAAGASGVLRTHEDAAERIHRLLPWRRAIDALGGGRSAVRP